MLPITTTTLPATTTSTTTSTTIKLVTTTTTFPMKIIPSDLDGNGCVGMDDVYMFEGYFGAGNINGDLDKDGDVDYDDFFLLSYQYDGCGE